MIIYPELFYTTHDTDEGSAAVFYSGFYPIEEAERNKVARVLTTQRLMKEIQANHPLVNQLYLNTYDSLNVNLSLF